MSEDHEWKWELSSEMAGSFEAFLAIRSYVVRKNYSACLYSALIKILIKEVKLSKFLWSKRLYAYNLFGTACLHKFTNIIFVMLGLVSYFLRKEGA